MYTYRFASSSSIHLTICVLRLDNELKIKKAAGILDKLLEMMRERGILGEDGLKISIAGVDTFPDLPLTNQNPKMFLLKIAEDENFEILKWISDLAIRECVKEGLIDLGENLNYRFHMSMVDKSFSNSKGQYLRPHDSTFYEGLKDPSLQIARLDSVGLDLVSDQNDVCIHSHPHITFLTGVRPPRDYKTFAEKNHRDFGGWDATAERFEEQIKSREGKISWRILIEKFNLFMAQEQNHTEKVRIANVPWIELSVMADSETDGSFKAVHRVPLSST